MTLFTSVYHYFVPVVSGNLLLRRQSKQFQLKITLSPEPSVTLKTSGEYFLMQHMTIQVVHLPHHLFTFQEIFDNCAFCKTQVEEHENLKIVPMNFRGTFITEFIQVSIHACTGHTKLIKAKTYHWNTSNLSCDIYYSLPSKITILIIMLCCINS